MLHQCFLSSRILTSGFVWLTVCVSSWQLKNTSSTLMLLPVATHKTSVALRVWLMKMAYLSLSTYIAIYLFFHNPSNFVCNSHQTLLMREIWWHFTIKCRLKPKTIGFTRIKDPQDGMEWKCGGMILVNPWLKGPYQNQLYVLWVIYLVDA